MKKLLSLILAGALAISIVGCAGEANNGGDKTEGDKGDSTSKGYELALITDVGTIDDRSFNQGAWEGLEKYAKENDITHKYYQPTEKTDSAYLETIKLAVENGAKLIVCPGYLFEPAVFQAQTEYPEVKFIILDGYPHNGDYNMAIEDNVYSVFYAEEQAGFLAGYAAVKEGYTKLGFMGGMAVPAVVRFGYGFVQGAEYAAEEMGISDIDVKYNYTGGFDATPEAQATAASWYQSGTEVIFGCGGAVGNSVMAAAKAAEGDKFVIGVDVDQSGESDKVITSSMKMLSKSVYDGIKAYYDGSFPGGQSVSLDAKVEGVGLPMENSKFKTFTQEDYDAIYSKLVAGDIDLYKEIEKDVDGKKEKTSPKDIELTAVKVEVIGE